MKLLICGGRDFNDRKLFRETMEGLPYPVITAVIHGGARGADTLADLWGKKYGVPVIRMDALWEAYGKKAGGMRNQAMLDLLQPDAVLAFPGGNGTADMVRRAEKAGIPTTVIQKDHWQEDEL